MRTLHLFMVVALFAGLATACNNAGQRTAGDSVEQAQDVNDTAAMVREKDADFAVKAADAGLAEIGLAKLALQKASSQQIKEFSQKIVDNHEQANDELMAIATQHNITLPPVISEDQVDKQRELREKSGAEFDEAYIDRMVRDHDKTVSLFEDASSDVRNADLQAFAAKTLPVLKRHYEEAKMLRDSINPIDTITTQRIMP